MVHTPDRGLELAAHAALDRLLQKLESDLSAAALATGAQATILQVVSVEAGIEGGEPERR